MLALPPCPRGMVLWIAHDAAPRPAQHSDYLAQELRRASLATLRLEPPGLDEPCADRRGFELSRLAARLYCAAEWLAAEPVTKELALGLFGTRLDAAAALQLAARRPDRVAAVVTSGGRPDLAGTKALAQVRAPTLLLVEEDDPAVVDCNRRAFELLGCEKDLAVIRGAVDRTERREPLPEVARLAARWFTGYLGADPAPAPAS